MKQENPGGLFKATYERIIRHNDKASSYVENINYYDSRAISKIKENLIGKKALKISSKSYEYNQLEIHNFNFIRDFMYYFNKLFNFEKRNLEHMLNTFIDKNEKEIIKADLIHAHWAYPNGYLAYRISQKYDLPYFITSHGNDLNNIRETEVPFLIEAMENAEKCFFVSKQLLENARAKGYSGKNAEITYNGVDIERFRRVKHKNSTNKVVGYVGALELVKGADLLPEIFAAIRKKYTEDVSFAVVGKGSLKNQIQERFKQNKIAVEFIGHIGFDEIPQELETMDVLIVPSRNEGLGMVILEANAMEVPAVGTKVGGIPEAIGYNENIIELGPTMIDNMAKRVVTILNSEKNDAIKYRKHIEKHFLWEDIVEFEHQQYLNVLE